MQHAASTLRKIFRESISRDDAPLQAWTVACGSKIAERTSALSFADGKLTVAVPDETWRRQLQSFAMQYLAALNQIVTDKVTHIEFVVANTQH
jgi:hypothetical protein